MKSKLSKLKLMIIAAIRELYPDATAVNIMARLKGDTIWSIRWWTAPSFASLNLALTELEEDGDIQSEYLYVGGMPPIRRVYLGRSLT